ncbi:MAG TPA: hypothetical protein PLZ15_10735 [Melioribacteraceae bacterium]|nr:hypothetical protein [Melioribacteraceae bacterium]
MHIEKLADSLRKLQNYIEENNYSGYDPYDALKSPLFKLPFFRNNKLIRFGVQQLVKRSPFNLRKLLVVPKGKNPVTLGLCIQAYSYLSEVYVEEKNNYLKKINELIEELIALIPKGYSSNCWGYDFDWESRYASIPAYQPTIVATGFIVNSLFECYRLTNIDKSKELIIGSKDFVLEDINRTYKDDGSFIFSYSPFDKQKVFNASMKGIRILSFIYIFTKEEELKTIATKAADYVLNSQNENGSWYYSKRASGEWVDNYHTGYILDCLDDFIKYCIPNDPKYQKALEIGYNYYLNNFFEKDSIPKFYNSNLYPIDCTSAGQSILTLLRFGDKKTAQNVAEFMIENIQSKEGYFYFRKFKYHKNTTSFMRWSNAWMFVSLSKIMTLYK